MKISQDILEILERCRIGGNILYLPPGQLDRKDYQTVNKCLENLGGKWDRRAKGHVFDHDPTEAFENMLLTGETTDMKKIFQFFPTPRAVAEQLCDLAELTEDSIVLEPSVGKGGIADAIWDRNVSYLLGIELNQDMKKYLDEKHYPTMVGVDFLEFAKEIKNSEPEQRFTHIIMNPPFSKQREIEHIMAAYELLAPGGILVSVLSNSPFWRTDAKSQGFREWLNSEDSFEFEEEIDLPEGTFKESGTMIPTKIIKLRREGVLDASAVTAIAPEILADRAKRVEAPTTRLMKVNYFDPKAEVRLECYADTVVTEQDGKNDYIAAIRLAGYPESVKGMADAIFGGGTVTVEVEGEAYGFSSKVKQYRREYSHDGLYAEAVLWIQDEDQQRADANDDTDSDEEGDNESTTDVPRKCYIFCAMDDDDQLYEEVDKKTAVPLIPEFKEYVLAELQCRDILKPLKVRSTHENFDAWVLKISSEETNIIDTVNDGLRYGSISIPGATSNDFPEVNGVTQYLNKFGVQIAERIKGQFNPLYDPVTEKLSPEILAVNDYIKATAGYSLYDAQLAVAETLKRRLERGKVAFCIAECGSGKTKIGTSALHAYQSIRRTRAGEVSILERPKHFNIILCPSHMANKWVREIEETLPNTFAVIITSITELHRVYEAYEQDDKTCYVILTKEKARDGYMRRPAAVWNKRRKRLICPDCFEEIEMEVIDCGSKYRVPADHFYFRKETKQNHKCENKECGSILWTVLVPERQSDWIKISDYGYVHRRFASHYLSHVETKPKVYDAIYAVAENPDGHYPNNGAYRRFPLSSYIKRKMRGKIDGLIIDEVHHYNNNSGQGDAMGELFQAAKKVIGMTATLINGYASGIFHLLFRVSPHLMLLDNKRYAKPSEFNVEYGVAEATYQIDAPDFNANRRTVKRKLREKQLPGVSPLVYSRYLMENAAFLSLNDMGKDLPEYEEIPIQLWMNDDVSREYERIESQLIGILQYQNDIAQKILSVYLNLLTVYPDQPYDHEPVKHPITGDDLIVPRDVSSIEELHEKDRHVLDLVQRKTQEGGRVLIYTSWTRIDTQDKLSKLLTTQGYRVAILTANVTPKKREEWVEKQVRSGVQVLITNPSLVETGLDLNDFTTILFFNISYNLFTLRQSSRRSWRINQRAPRIEVYFFYYKDTMQHRAIRLMASKLAVAGVIEGNLTDEGLAAMSDCQDMTTALARELTNGIEGEVEDLGAVFKRMALLKPVADVIEGEAVVVESVANNGLTDDIVIDDVAINSEATEITAPKPIAPTADSATQAVKELDRPKQPTQSSGLASLLSEPKPKRTQKKKTAVLDNQMSLFDLLEAPA